MLSWFTLYVKRFVSSGLLRKISAGLLIASLIPLWVISSFALTRYNSSKDYAVQRSAQNVNDEASEGLKGRTLLLAQRAASFLEERESDVRTLATLPRTPESFADFARAKQGQLWTVIEKEENGERTYEEIRFNMPLYRELAFVDMNGQEIVKVSNECDDYPFSCEIVVSDELVNVGDIKNTLFKNERYFLETKILDGGEVYVGEPVGLHVPYERAYAGAQNRSGERYRGVIRFATPVFDGEGKKVGMVVEAVEMLHFIELTAHVAPANPQPQAEIDPREADFVYAVSPEGWAMSHPRHFNIAGVDENGGVVPFMREQNRDDPENLFLPGNLNLMGFIDPVFPELVKKNAEGESGTMTFRLWDEQGEDGQSAGFKRVLAYATIPYYTGHYGNKAGFGLIVMSTDGERFDLEATLLGKQIENSIVELSTRMKWVAWATVAGALVLALVLSRTLVWPILDLMETAHEIEEGDWENADIEGLAETRGGDEVARLSRIFASMAKEVYSRELRLRQQVEELRVVIDETKRKRAVSEITDSEFFQDLSKQARDLRERKRKTGKTLPGGEDAAKDEGQDSE